MKIKKVLSIIWSSLIKPICVLPFVIIKLLFGMIRTVFGKITDKLRLSITFRITTLYAFIIAMTLLLLNTGIIMTTFSYILKSESDDLQKNLSLISTYMSDNNKIPDEHIKKLSEVSNISISIFDENQKLLFTTEEESSDTAFIDKYRTDNIFIESYNYNQMIIANLNTRNSNIPKNMFNEYGYALVLNDSIITDTSGYYVQIIDKLSKETAYARIFILSLLALDILLLVLIIIIGSAASKRLLRPIRVMTDTAKNISIKQLDTRLDISGSKTELKDLAITFNNMLDRIQLAYEQQNRFVSDASHELRTPISVIQGYTNLLDRWGKDDKKVLEESISAIKTESDNMKGLVEKLLFLARGDKGTQKVEKEDFYINELIDEIVKETRLIDNSHDIVSEKNESIKINADRSLLKEAVRVFIDNSVKYTPEGGRISLECYLWDHNAEILIEDTGIGISKKDLPHVFDRFYRADKSRTKQTGGTGLGMSIAKWIILKHNGTVRIQSELNTGTKVYINIPCGIAVPINSLSKR